MIYGSNFVDLVALDKWYKSISVSQLDKTYINALNLLFDQLKHGIQTISQGQTAALIIILRNPLFSNVEMLALIMPKLSFVIATLSQSQRIEFAWTLQESLLRSEQEAQALAHMFRQIVSLFTRFITIRVLGVGAEEGLYFDEPLMWSVQSLAVLCIYCSNSHSTAAINDASSFLPYYEFYNEAVETCLDIKDDYPKFKGKEGYFL